MTVRRPAPSRAAAVGALFAAIAGQAPARAATEPGTEDADALLTHPDGPDDRPATPGAWCDRPGAHAVTPDGTPLRCTHEPGEDRPRWRRDA